MILFFPLVLGLIFGWLRRGRVANLAVLPVRHAWLPLVAVGLQLGFVFFSGADPGVPSSVRVGMLLATYGGLIGFLLLNRSLPGAVFLLLGASLNAAVMAANGGYMPITPEALTQSGHEGQIVGGDGSLFVYGSKDIVLEAEDTRLGFLSDIFGIPEELPFSATFSLGDVLIGLGAAVLIASGMRPQATGVRHQASGSRPSLSGGAKHRSRSAYPRRDLPNAPGARLQAPGDRRQGPSGAARHQAARASGRRGQWSVVSGQGREPAQALSTVAGILEAGNRKLEAER